MEFSVSDGRANINRASYFIGWLFLLYQMSVFSSCSTLHNYGRKFVFSMTEILKYRSPRTTSISKMES